MSSWRARAKALHPPTVCSNETSIPPKFARSKPRAKNCRVAIKVGNGCANKVGTGFLEDWAMEQDNGFGSLVWSVAEVVDVSIGAEAADDGGAGWSVNGMALGADGDFAVVADADAGLLAPDVGPPRAMGDWAEDGTFFGEGLLLSGLGCLAEFAVDFMLVGVGHELVDQVVGPDQFDDVVGGQKGHETFLPVVVAAFDFAFGLRGWGIEQVDAVEVKGLAELGEGVGVVGVEEGVVVHIEDQGQTVGLEDAGEEVEVGQQSFVLVEACAGVEPRGIVEDVQQDLFVGAVGQPGVRAGVVLPEGAVVAGLPAFDGFGGGFVAGVGGQLMGEGPTPDAGTVGFEVEAAMEFAGGGAVGGRWFGREKFGDQGGHFGGPARVVIAAGQSGRPGLAVALSADEQVVSAQLVEAAQADAQFERDGFGREDAGAGLGKEMADQWRGNTVSELKFFIALKIVGRWI
jgi:hypothetical protein